jgi:hypothetical protein
MYSYNSTQDKSTLRIFSPDPLLLSLTTAGRASVSNNDFLKIYKMTLGDLQLKLKFRIPDKPNYSNYTQQHYSWTLLLTPAQ